MESITQLLEIVKSLRDPETGCPWNRRQTFATIAAFTLEETYELIDAIDKEDPDNLCYELGDLLWQVIYHSRLAEEAGMFNFNNVVKTVSAKMVRRNPHVFSDADIADEQSALNTWQEIKAKEGATETAVGDQKRSSSAADSLARVSHAIPALLRAQRLQKIAATVGFDWNNIQPVLAKVNEELLEVREQINAGTQDQSRIEEEIGDLIFSCVNLSRHLAIDPEAALRKANRKFEQRLAFVENELAKTGNDMNATPPEVKHRLWDKAKDEPGRA